MYRATCYVGRIDGFDTLPAMHVGGRSITTIFRDASSERDPAGDIHLTFDTSRHRYVRGLKRGPVTALHLHHALRRLTINPASAQRVHRIGVIFAHSYEWDTRAFGVMFDRGFKTEDDTRAPNGSYAIPREGCAVFLKAIAQHRTPPHRAAETAITTVHELGHVFNLRDNSGDTFMGKPSLGGATIPSGTGFLLAESRWLSECSRSEAVWPGGLDFRGASAQRRIHGNLQLRIDLSRDEVFAFEPFELDVKLTWPKHERRSTWISRDVDPGYSGFRIWIEDPSGAVRLWASPNHYCRPSDRIALAPGESFERDISLFGQSGGYTFRLPGTHRIWAEYDVGRRGTIRSNSVPLHVRGFHRSASALELLAVPSVARLLYYRRASLRSRALRQLEVFSNEHPKHAAAGHAAYATGRVVLAEWAATEEPGRKRRLARRAYESLRRAADHPGLGRHARKRAKDFIDNLERT